MNPRNKMIKILPIYETNNNNEEEEPKQSPLEKPKSTFKKTGGKPQLVFYNMK